MMSSDVNVTITSYSNLYTNTIIQNGGGRLWRCMGVYGHSETQ